MDFITPIINAATGGMMDMIMGPAEDARQVKQQQKLTSIQEMSAGRLAANAKENAFDLWQRTNAAAQAKEYEKAGLNTGLMYKSGGAGGITTGGATPMPTGGTAATAAQTMANKMDMMMMGAQIENMKADTELKKADTVKTAGVDTDLTTANAAIARVQAEIAGKSIDQQLDIIDSAATTAINNASISGDQRTVSNSTVNDQIGQVKQEYINLAIEAAAKQSNIELNKTKITEITNSIQQKWKELNITETKNRYEHNDRIKAIEEYTSNALKVAGIQAVGNVVGDVVRIATKTPQMKGKSVETVGRDGKSHYEYTQYH